MGIQSTTVVKRETLSQFYQRFAGRAAGAMLVSMFVVLSVASTTSEKASLMRREQPQLFSAPTTVTVLPKEASHETTHKETIRHETHKVHHERILTTADGTPVHKSLVRNEHKSQVVASTASPAEHKSLIRNEHQSIVAAPTTAPTEHKSLMRREDKQTAPVVPTEHKSLMRREDKQTVPAVPAEHKALMRREEKHTVPAVAAGHKALMRREEKRTVPAIATGHKALMRREEKHTLPAVAPTDARKALMRREPRISTVAAVASEVAEKKRLVRREAPVTVQPAVFDLSGITSIFPMVFLVVALVGFALQAKNMAMSLVNNPAVAMYLGHVGKIHKGESEEGKAFQ